MKKLAIIFFIFLLSSNNGFSIGSDKDHVITQESIWANEFIQVGTVYGAAWILYPLTQPSIFSDKSKGSWSRYKKNFGRITYDKDGPFWNLGMHPLAGSYYYLAYRNWGHSKMKSMFMTFVSSALFEITIEAYSEPPSIQDLYQTPVLGSLLGFGFEWLGDKLFNGPLHYLSFLFNPFLFFNSENQQTRKSSFVQTDFKKSFKLTWSIEF